MPVEIVSARLTHVGPIASRMRDVDRRECSALGRTPKEGLRIGLRMSLRPLTAVIDGVPEAMFGAVPLSMVEGRALAWMLATDAIYCHKRALALIGPRVVADWLSTFLSLENVVSAENGRAIRYLAHLGFHVGGATQVHRGLAFVPFHLGRAIQEVPVPA